MKIKSILLSFVCIFFFFTSEVIAQTTYSKVRVQLEGASQLNDLFADGYDIDHFEGDPDQGISFFVTPQELQKLSESNYQYVVEIVDYAAHYAKLQEEDQKNLPQVTRSSNVGGGYGYGSMGGFYTFSEIEGKLDEMLQDYPDLITAKTSIGTTEEGRPIWMVKISDNPTINEAEPVAYFDALHHAREPLSAGTTLNYMFWLLENYDNDPQVQYLIDNREIYFVPVVNPDGYVYNETTDPNGGGFWRKNRNPNGGAGCFGVDLNRNYSYEFAMNNNCSSPDPCSNIYRGETAFSEAESVAVRDLLATVGAKTAFSIHSTAGSYLMPYGFDTSPPAFPIYSEWASAFLKDNDYPYGVTFQMLGYTTCGTTRDFFHSEGIYGWTPEIDGAGFWPPQSTIFDLVGENVYPLFYQSWIAGGYVDVQSHSVIGDALKGGAFDLLVTAKNIGLEDAQDVSLQVIASSPDIVISPEVNLGTIIARERANNVGDLFTIEVPSTFGADSFELTISVLQEGVLNDSIDLTIFIGEETSLFFDDAEGGSGNWTASGNGISWGTIQDDSYSGVQCFGDSNDGNGLNDTLNYFELDQTFDLTSTDNPVVSFMTKHSIEENDTVNFQISTNSGGSWTSLETFSLNEIWQHYHTSLAAYTAFDEVQFRFRLQNNGFIPGDGFYFDDFKLSDFDTEVLATPTNAIALVEVAPNPFTSEINVTGVIAQGTNLVVYDIHGRIIANEFSQGKKNSIRLELEQLTLGVYFLKLADPDGNQKIFKLIKQ